MSWGAVLNAIDAVEAELWTVLEKSLEQQKAARWNADSSADHDAIVGMGGELNARASLSLCRPGGTRQRSACHPCSARCFMPSEMPA